jgi:hypothetical protein
MLGASATLMLVILRLLARVCPPLCSRRSDRPNQPYQQRFRGGADKGSWSIEAHPRLHGYRINSTRQPQARGRVSQIADASALGNGGPSESPLESRGVQLVAGLGHEQTGICVSISSHGSYERQDSVGNRNATGPYRFGALGINALGLCVLHHQSAVEPRGSPEHASLAAPTSAAQSRHRSATGPRAAGPALSRGYRRARARPR